MQVLARITSHDRHRFWSDDASYTDVAVQAARGHADITDLYLVALAAAHGDQLVSLDRPLARLAPTVLVIPT